MPRLPLAAALLAAALALSACAAPGPRPTGEATVVTASAIVDSVNPTTRILTLRDEAGGAVFSVRAGPEVRNFDQIEPGDRVELDLIEAVVLEMADPDDPGEPVTLAAAGRAEDGDRPGAGALLSTSFVVTVVSYDRQTGLAAYRLPDGTVRRTTLAPEMRVFAEARRPGERVLVTITDAIAITVSPKET